MREVPFVYLVKTKYLSFLSENETNERPVSWQTGLSTGTHINDVFRLNNAKLENNPSGKKTLYLISSLYGVCDVGVNVPPVLLNPFQRSKVTACICWVEKQGTEKKTFDNNSSHYSTPPLPICPSLILPLSCSPTHFQFRHTVKSHHLIHLSTVFHSFLFPLSLPLLTGIKEWH